MSYHKIIHRMEVKETNHTSILNPKTTPKYFHRYKHDVAYSASHTTLRANRTFEHGIKKPVHIMFYQGLS